jgi:hypothetical protein
MMTRCALLLLPLLAGCRDRYFVNEAAETLPNLYLHEVRLSGGATKLVFRYEADEACEVSVPEGISLVAAGETRKLTGASGIADPPGTTRVGARGSLRFSLEFEPLPEGATVFAVEGGPWQFPRVDLKDPNVVECP